MSLTLTPDSLAAAFEFLRTTKPIVTWRLPPAAEIRFKVSGHRDRFGDCKIAPPWCISISGNQVGHTYILLATMAHEMIHLYQFINNKVSPNARHNAEFVKLTRQVARCHGFDPKFLL